MTRVRAAEAAVAIAERDGAAPAFGLPGAAINSLSAAKGSHGDLRHVPARHIEGASHVADGSALEDPALQGEDAPATISRLD